MNKPLTNPLWGNNELQFARLLSELLATGTPTSEQMRDLQVSMNLCEQDIKELLHRAVTLWEDAKYVEFEPIEEVD